VKKILVLILTAFVLGAQAAPADDYTPKERQMLKDLRVKMIATCESQVDAIMKQKLKEEEALVAKLPTLSSWLADLLGTLDYCTCSMDKGIEKMTPYQFRYGTKADGQALGRLAGAECLLPRLKAGFPGFCNGMLKEASRSKGLETAPEAIADVCRCVQQDVDAITVDTLDSVSLSGSLTRCGIGDLGRNKSKE
jgi:hypothetical protein